MELKRCDCGGEMRRYTGAFLSDNNYLACNSCNQIYPPGIDIEESWNNWNNRMLARDWLRMLHDGAQRHGRREAVIQLDGIKKLLELI
jgi:hypothetical protein